MDPLDTCTPVHINVCTLMRQNFVNTVDVRSRTDLKRLSNELTDVFRVRQFLQLATLPTRDYVLGSFLGESGFNLKWGLIA